MADVAGFERATAPAGSSLGPLMVAGVDLAALDRGLLGWSYDVLMALGTGSPTAGTVTGSRVRHGGGTITNILMATGGSPLIGGTAGQNFVAIYDVTTSARLALSVDLTTQLATLPSPSSDPWVFPLSAPIILPAGMYDVAVLQNLTPGLAASFCRANGATGQTNVRMPLGSSNFKGWIADTAATAMPATLAAKSSLATPFWFALA